MLKKIKITLTILMLIVFAPASVLFGQYIPNAPFKQQYLAAPDFTLQDIRGKTFRMSAQRGKPVLIFFGTTWCPNCRAEIEVYKKVYETYAPRGLEIIYINIMEPAKKVTRFAQAHSLFCRVLMDEDGSVGYAYNVIGVPTIMLVDKSGYIIKIGHSTSEMPLDKVLQAK